MHVAHNMVGVILSSDREVPCCFIYKDFVKPRKDRRSHASMEFCEGLKSVPFFLIPRNNKK